MASDKKCNLGLKPMPTRSPEAGGRMKVTMEMTEKMQQGRTRFMM